MTRFRPGTRTAIGRRDLLRLMTSSGVGAFLPACSDDAPRDTRSQVDAGPARDGASEAADLDVAVVGGGVSGLAIAEELVELGYRVRVFEATGRVGGRVRTVRDGFIQNQYCEVGATRIPNHHDLTIHHAQRLGLELTEYGADMPLYSIGAQRFLRPDPGESWPLALSPDEQTGGADYWLRVVLPEVVAAGNLEDGTFPSEDAVLRFDGITVVEHLKDLGATDDYIRLLLADQGSSLAQTGMLHVMLEVLGAIEWRSSYGIVGGNDQLGERLAARVTDVLELGAAVTAIADDGAYVRLSIDQSGAAAEVTARRLVIAAPFSALRSVDISPALPDDKRRTIAELNYVNSARGYLQAPGRPWLSEGVAGLSIIRTDLRTERFWDVSAIQPGSAGMLAGYAMAQNADFYATLDDAAREQQLRGDLDAVLPGAGAEALRAGVHVWSEQPFAKGAFSGSLPGQWWMIPVARRPEGKLHFAGEHTSDHPGWIQGAFESVRRVVDEIVEAEPPRG